MDETEIAGRLGQLLAGQENTNREIAYFRDEAARAATAASDSRRTLYQTMEDLKDKLVADVHEVKSDQKLLNMRIQDATNQMNMWAPNVLDIPRIQTAVVEIRGAHDDLKKTVNAIHEAKISLEGAARASKVWWMVLSGTVGGLATAAWHWFSTGASPPGR